MTISLNTNASALSSMRQLTYTQHNINKTMQRLTTGLRVSNAADDAAGLAISENLQRQILGNQQGSRNATDGISLIEVTESSLNEISDILLRTRQLALHASSESLSANDRAALNEEFKILTNSADGVIKSILESSRFNDSKLIDNSAPPPVTIQTGSNATDTLSMPTRSYSGLTIFLNIFDLTTPAKAKNAINNPNGIDYFLEDISNYRATLGATQNRLEARKNNLASNIEKTIIARGRIIDADYAKEATDLAKYQIKQQAGIQMLSKSFDSFQLILQLIK